jgi:two-component system, LytTR family, sensor kinase
MLLKSVNQLINKRPGIHILFWILFVLAGSFIFSYQQNFPYRFYLLNFLVHMPLFLLYTYGVIYFLIPGLLLRRKYVLFFFVLILLTFLAALLRVLVNRYVYYTLFIPEVLYPEKWIGADFILINVLWIISPAILFAMFKYYKNWLNSQTLANEAEKKQLASELQVLKAQINPHFLFNTFNNLYALALQKSDKTPEVISRISDLFHYVLYECNSIEVPVSKEIKLIQDYIRLEKLRYSDRLSIKIKSEIDNPEFLIPSMMLYTFTGNCFKHGCSNDPDSPWIHLSIKVSGNRFEFEASNSVPRILISRKEQEAGVGLANIRRRLELLYPKNHRLEIRKDNDVFVVRLEIKKERIDK